MHTLDWKHAWTGRLLTTAPTRPQALKLLEPQLDSCNARLIGEVASGKLPFLNLPFRSSLTARLKALTPQLRRFKHMVVLGIGGSALGVQNYVFAGVALGVTLLISGVGLLIYRRICLVHQEHLEHKQHHKTEEGPKNGR